MADESPARITRVRLKNYKSIVSCDVELKPLTILVGPNGSGKSNFVDALRFVSEALTVGLEQAIRHRGNVRRILSQGRVPGDDSFGIKLGLNLSATASWEYEVEINTTPDERGFHVKRESLTLRRRKGLMDSVVFAIEDDGIGGVEWTLDDDIIAELSHRTLSDFMRGRPSDRLFLISHSVSPDARPVYDLLTSIAFYNPDPRLMRVLAPSEAAQRLLEDGRNVATILRRLQETDLETMWRITTHLSRILPGLERLEVEDLRGYDLLTFHQRSQKEGKEWDFTPDQMSDGTLRALAVLVALFQNRMGGKSRTSLVGIEEPETGLHPAATAGMLNAMIDASSTSQVLVTTHSSDMLHLGDIDVESLLAVEAEDGVTRIGAIDSVGRSILKDRLATVGELLQTRLLHPSTDGSDANGPNCVTEPVAG